MGCRALFDSPNALKLKDNLGLKLKVEESEGVQLPNPTETDYTMEIDVQMKKYQEMATIEEESVDPKTLPSIPSSRMGINQQMCNIQELDN
jgi:hypothetical protein